MRGEPNRDRRLQTITLRIVGVSFVGAWVAPIVVFFDGSLAVVLLCVLCAVLGWRLPVSGSSAEGMIELCERLGIRRFKRFVTNGDLTRRWFRKVAPSVVVFSGPASIRQWYRATVLGERIHWAFLLGSLPVLGWAAIHGGWGFAIYLLFSNIVFNIYPILLQRYNRTRIIAIANRYGCPLTDGSEPEAPPGPGPS